MRDRYEQREGQSRSAARESRSKRTIFRRTVFLMVMFGAVMFAPLVWKLWDIAIVHHEDYQQRATNQQLMDVSVAAKRGDIFDRNGNTMAMSATVYNLILSPRDLVASVSEKKFTKDGVLDEAAYQKAIQDKRELIADGICAALPDIERESVEKRILRTDSAYEVIQKNIEGEPAEQLKEFIAEHKLGYSLQMVPSTKRYYPYSGLAAQVLGYVNAEGGAIGIEAAYDDVLEGTAGRVVTTKTGAGTQMYNNYSEFIDAIDGYDLTLTIDATIQSYAEKALEKGIKAYDVRNGAFCIVMNPKTGAIYAMASSPDFDPNNYSKIVDPLLEQKMNSEADAIFDKLQANNTEGLTKEELLKKAQNEAYFNAVNAQWRSKAVDSRYEPGSTFKAIVLAAALEEGLVTESDTFFCPGYHMVPGWDKPIKCSKGPPGHGSQTLAKAVQNSCNPAFMVIGQRLGIDKFYDYFEAFGMKEKTGIDLPGEASLVKNIWDRDKMTNVDLAVASFGQRFGVTPLQMITGFSAVINGGNLVQPYVVQSVSTKDGTVVKNTEPNVVRQVVSQQTSERATKILESVVAEGTGNNAYVPGYRIGGKTGSSETDEEGRTIVSFMGFAPADDPEVIVLLAYDKPQEREPGSKYGTTGVYISGGNMAAVQAGPLIADILDYLGVEKKYTQEESAAVDVPTPRVTGLTVDAAAEKLKDKKLKDKNLKYRTVGEGEVITHQVPVAGAAVPSGSTLVFYLGSAVPEESGAVPNVVGLTYEAARKRLEDAGFFMRSSGVSVYYGNTTTASGQSVAAGETAPIGTVIDVQFANVMEDGWVETR